MKQSFKAVIKLKRELPTDIKMRSISSIELSTLAEDVYDKTTEALQNTDIDMREFSGIHKGLQGELTNNGFMLREINEIIKK